MHAVNMLRRLVAAVALILLTALAGLCWLRAPHGAETHGAANLEGAKVEGAKMGGMEMKGAGPGAETRDAPQGASK